MKLWFAKRMKQLPAVREPHGAPGIPPRLSRRSRVSSRVRLAIRMPRLRHALVGISLALLEEIREAPFPGESGGCFEIDTPLLTA